MQQKPKKPPQISEQTMQEPLLPVTCRCGRTIFVERRDVLETHRCPSCAARFTIVNVLDRDGNAIASPKYTDEVPKPSPRPSPSPMPSPAKPKGETTLEPAKKIFPPPTAAKAPPTPEERMRLSEILPPNGAIREFLTVLNDENVADSPLLDAAAKALVRLAGKSVPFLTANLMAGPFHAHAVTMRCLREIGEASAAHGLLEYARSLRNVGQDALKGEAEELAFKLMRDGK